MSTLSLGTTQPAAGDNTNELLRKILVTQNGVGSVNIVDGANAARVDGEGNLGVVNVPFDFEIAEHGEYQGRPAMIFSIFGWREGFTSTSILQDIAAFLPNQVGGAAPRVPDMTGVESLEVVSSSASDTSGGAGARSVHVTYLDTDNNIVMSPDIVLSGITPVALPFLARFIYWVEVSEVGTNTTSVGNVDVRTVGGPIHARVEANGNRSGNCTFRVPAGFTGYVLRWGASSRGGADQRVFIRTQSHLLDGTPSGGPFLFRDVNIVTSASDLNREAPYWKVPALTNIKISTQPTATAAQNRVDASFQIVLIANE
jgi:hypothetical protein